MFPSLPHKNITYSQSNSDNNNQQTIEDIIITEENTPYSFAKSNTKETKDTDTYSTDCATVCGYIMDPYCCAGTPYDNICYAECDGVISPETKCDKGQCPNTPKPSYKPTDLPTIECDECDPNENDPICCHRIEYISFCFAQCYDIDT